MKDAIHQNGTNAHGTRTSAGVYAVHPDGHLVLLAPQFTEFKPGWRAATMRDIEAAKAKAAQTPTGSKSDE